MIVQFCGLSGSGKSTLSENVKTLLEKKGIPIEIIDGDEYRNVICRDLGFSKKDRHENLRRLAFVAGKLSKHKIITIISAINPYEEIRQEITSKYRNVKTVYISCSIEVLLRRDTKGLYKRALLPDGHPEKINNLSGINDTFEIPEHPDLVINTESDGIEICSVMIAQFILDSSKNS